MAYNPIVLKSNIVPSSGLGALPNMYRPETGVRRDSTIENEDGTFTIPTYQRTEIDIPDDFDWSMYGTKYAPMLRYFNKVRTGEIIYNPEDDRINEDLLGEMIADTDSNLPTEAEMIKQELIGVGTQLAAGIGGQIGRSVAANVGDGDFTSANITGGLSDFSSNFDFGKMGGDIFGAPETGPASQVKFSPGSDNAEVASLNKQISDNKITLEDLAVGDKDAIKAKKSARQTDAATRAGLLETGDTGIFSGMKDRADIGFFGDNKMSAAGRANLYGSTGVGLGVVAANLISGKNLKESVKTGAKVGVGNFIGTAIGGSFGGLIGSVLGGRVICNELMRQNIMTRKQVVLDYKFTEDYLTPQHVAGYHVWAVWMVKQMRKGRLVNFWTHVAGHRANEIAYIYGERDKPDYLGKVYRKVLEPICWSIGFFCQKTDWTVLYKQKEI
jgi:hypothetical protein